MAPASDVRNMHDAYGINEVSGYRRLSGGGGGGLEDSGGAAHLRLGSTRRPSGKIQ